MTLLKQQKLHAIAHRGEVFTPEWLVNQMLDKLPAALFTDPAKTFCDNSCGHGNILIEVLKRKMASDIPATIALGTIYGVELDDTNCEECRVRLLEIALANHEGNRVCSLGGNIDTEKLRAIVDHNIICADALDPKHNGWDTVGFYWDGE